MRFMPILAKTGNYGRDQAAGVFTGPLPDFYMNDYSVMGLRVSDCAATFKLLEEHCWAVIDRQGCLGVAIRSAAEIRKIIDLLTANGVRGELADVAEQMYQG